MFNEKERKFKILKLEQLEEIFNQENVKEEDMINFIENINSLCNFSIYGYAENWLVDSIDMTEKFDIRDKRIEEKLDYKIDEVIFPQYIKLTTQHNKNILIRSSFVSNLEENSLIYDLGCTPYDITLSKEYVYYGYRNAKKELRKDIVETSNKNEYINQYFDIAKNYLKDLKKI